MPIIITVPHSVCIDTIDRDCDRRATTAARLLYRILIAKGCDVHLHTSDLYRSETDANRLESRNTRWRKQLGELINTKLKTGPVFVIDVHSFPPEDGFTGSYKAYMIELWFRTNDKIYQGWSDSEKRVAKLALNSTLGDKTDILLGDWANDIMLTSNMAGANTVILEVNESTTVLSDTELEKLMTALANSLLQGYC